VIRDSSISSAQSTSSSIIMCYNDRDAAWEMENDAFNDLLERHCQCDVSVCRCPQGRHANLLDTLVSTLLIVKFSWYNAVLNLT